MIRYININLLFASLLICCIAPDLSAVNAKYHITVPGGIDQFCFSANGATVAVASSDSVHAYVQINNKTYGGFDAVGKVILSDDGLHHAFIYSLNDLDYINKDDSIYGGYEKIDTCGFFNENKGFWFIYRRENLKSIWVSGKVKHIKRAGYYDPVIAGNNTCFRYLYNQKLYCYINDTLWGPYNIVDVNDFILNPQANDFAFWFKQKGKIYIQQKSKRYGPYTKIEWQKEGSYLQTPFFKFSKDGSHFAYWCAIGESCYVYTDVSRYGPFENVFEFDIENDGTVNYLFAKQGRLCDGVNDSTAIGPFGDYDRAFIHNGKGCSYIYRRDGKLYYHIGGSDYGPYTYARLASFSYAQNHFIYCFTINNKDYFNLDGSISEEFERINDAWFGTYNNYWISYIAADTPYTKTGDRTYNDWNAQLRRYSSSGAPVYLRVKNNNAKTESELWANDSLVGRYNEIFNDGLYDGSKIWLCYRVNDKVYLSINGNVIDSVAKNVFIPYTGTRQYRIVGTDDILLRYQLGKDQYVYYKDSKYGPFQTLEFFVNEKSGHILIGYVNSGWMVVDEK